MEPPTGLQMTLPPFNNDGLLPPGIWTCDGREFIDRFCQSDYRKPETAPTWGRAVAPLAEWVAGTLWSRERKPIARTSLENWFVEWL